MNKATHAQKKYHLSTITTRLLLLSAKTHSCVTCEGHLNVFFATAFSILVLAAIRLFFNSKDSMCLTGTFLSLSMEKIRHGIVDTHYVDQEVPFLWSMPVEIS